MKLTDRQTDMVLVVAMALIGALVMAGLVSAFIRETDWDHAHPRVIPAAVRDANRSAL